MHDLRLVTTIKLIIGAMLAIVLALTVMMVWTSQRAGWLSDRMNLAHQVYETHLSLSAHAYQLFKQYGDALIIGDRDQGVGERELIAAVRADIERLRMLIALEIDHVGPEESSELETLAEIEAKTNSLIAALETYRTAPPEGAFRSGWSKLSTILDGEIDRDFRGLIDRAIADEVNEVDAARAQIEHYARMNRIFASCAALSTLLAAAGAVVLVDRRIRRPAQNVLAGVEKFGAGDYEHRIALRGCHEFSQIAQALDGMAAKIQDRTQLVLEQRADLERKVAQRTAQLEAMLERAQTAERNRRTLLSDVSHELKTPLTIIRGEADIALRGAASDTAPLREALERTRHAAIHTARIVDDLLFIARAEEGKPRIATETIDLAELLHEVARNFASDATVTCRATPAPVSADPGRLRQAILIFYDNARRHGGSEIVFLLNSQDDCLHVSVEDNGPGMSDAEKAQAFERFFRGSGAMSSATPGLGLGLPVARAIIEAHGGAVSLSDRAGGGLVASFTLPAQRRLRAVS